MLQGRGDEQAAIGALLEGARAGAGGALVLHGEPGAGKSALLADAADGVRTLRATGAEPEQGLAFAALHQLLHPVTGLLDALPVPQRDALRGALGLAPGTADARFLVAAGVLSLLTEAAGDGVLLCLLDDFQWFDRASADALLFAARRLGGERVALLAATRDPAPTRGLPSLHVTGLDAASASTLLPGASAPVRDRLVELTGGNPLALTEAARVLSPAQLAGREPLPDPLPVGGALFAERLARLPEATRALLLVAAAEGQGDLDTILRAARELGADAGDLSPAESAGLITVDGPALRFRHPLIRSAAYTPADRRRAHAALAVAARDADRRARHRAAATVGRDAAVADELADAAARADARGGHTDAATAWTRAADLTPDPAVRARRLAAAATAAWLGGRPGQAETCLAAARELAEDPELLAELARLRGRFELNSGDAAEAQRILLDAGALADAAEAAGHVGDIAALVDIGHRAEKTPAPFLRDVLTGIGATLSGDLARGGPLLRAALAQADGLTTAAELLWAATAASYLGEADVAAALTVRAGRIARVSGTAGQLPVVLEFVSTGERIAGNLALAAAVAEEGLALAREAGYTNSAAAHLANLAAVAAIQGREEECAEYAREALAIAIPHRVGLRVSVAVYALGMLDLSLGRFAAAHARFASMVTAGPGAGHPASVRRSAPDRIEAAVFAGETDAAREALSAYEGWTSDAATSEARALLSRCRALLADGDDAVALYEEALRLHAGSPFDEARTALLYGERLRRAHRAGDARAPLRAAAETFGRIGAAPWADRALAELRAAGEAAAAPAPDALAALTPQELRIAGLVAGGASSKEVAATLFLSPRTVEYHLYKIYPKLGISSRTELARYWAARGQ
ncbi:AAA family ATPase [Actinomadura macrotermitis]|uniref:HTH luxR-type domain-containing protein n=1 Tax=Actinomadura macrotermitis TaxID=2585200 RepID=A0A7K0BX23_9ACTN|nr:LuxR family transcriptional regulator [Actinomadura macrotermitis]MQY05730.1 hypothetical protein [Actinomadura macrotermitis]